MNINYHEGHFPSSCRFPRRIEKCRCVPIFLDYSIIFRKPEVGQVLKSIANRDVQ